MPRDMAGSAPDKRLRAATGTTRRWGEPATRVGTAAVAPAWRATWAGYAACAWALVFAAMSFYWAAGGLAGIETQGHAIKDAALASERDPLFVALVWGTGAAKVLGTLLALALVRPWGRTLPRWLLLVPAWAGGVGMLAYGGIPLVVNGLMLAGLLRVPGPVDWVAIRWHFLLWDPWWTVGGSVFVAAAWSYQRRTRRRGEMA